MQLADLSNVWGNETPAGQIESITGWTREIKRLLHSAPKGSDLLAGLNLLAEEKRYKITRDGIFARADAVMRYITIGEWNDFVEISNLNAPPGQEHLFRMESIRELVDDLKRLRQQFAELEDTARAVLSDISTDRAVREYLDSRYRADMKKLDGCLPHLKLLLTGRRLGLQA
jgi:hypothetical protein